MNFRPLVRLASVLVVLVVGVQALAPSAGARSEPGPRVAYTSVMSWNITGGDDYGSEAYAQHIAFSLGDIVGLQEVCLYQTNDIEGELEQQTGEDWVSRFGQADGTSLTCLSPFGQAMFVKSHLQPRNWANTAYPKENGCDVDPEERAYQAVTVTLGATTVRVFNTHLAAEWKGDCQSDILRAEAMRWPNAIVLGDFNLRTDHPSIAEWAADGFRNMHPNNFYTATNNREDCNVRPTVKIDYVWVRGSITKDFGLAPLCNEVSDHRALVAGVRTP